jgi:hypothetical protein
MLNILTKACFVAYVQWLDFSRPPEKKKERKKIYIGGIYCGVDAMG